MLSNEQLLQAAKLFGSPLYVYDLPGITSQYERLKNAFRQFDNQIFYACKALTNPHILKHITALGCGIDCSSINEVRLALFAGCPADRILYTSNGIAFSEIEEAVSLGVHTNIDSLSNLEKFGAKYGSGYPVGIRIRPNILAGGNIKISTGHSSSKFGISLENETELVALCNKYSLQVNCLHIHTGSEIGEIDVFIKGIEVLFRLAKNFPALKSFDLGGGFKVPYKVNETGTDVESLGPALADTLVKNNCALELWFEPGKFLVSEAGYLLSTVNVLKHNEEITIAGLDTGFNHLIRPMFYDSYHHILNLSNPSGAEQLYHVAGNICETDTFAKERSLPEIREGDVMAFLNAGAYGFEMSSYFNSRFRPAEVSWTGEAFKVIRRRDEFDDLLSHIPQI